MNGGLRRALGRDQGNFNKILLKINKILLKNRSIELVNVKYYDDMYCR